MTRKTAYIITVTQMLTLASMMLTYLAHLWETIGLGLNPWIALPCASVLVLMPYVAIPYLYREGETI